ncbi:hypothetical protein MAM1_0150c06646 [Mucor ambiguus]|uniref:Protein Zds1 C-terminal domain-containing protein n=1 Tax=Mucor ambiguus TaxID=91626 RepID=A0A0C9MY62_9FUNG|nr:hypothetical protein MAM1_0150c06646 [Mucor ambiguus]
MDQSPNTTLPEINMLNQDDWDFLSKPPPATDKEEQQQQQQQQPSKDTQPASTPDSESKTTGLTRALSLPRQLNKTADNSTNVKEDSIRTEVINIATANPSHLFWVPASQHPEIAPAEFEKYVDAHGLMIRKKSVKRRQSVLSVYFTASDHQKLMEECDTAEAEKDRQAALSALESKYHAHKQSSESEEEEEEEDTKKRKTMLRRSVSLHLPTTGGMLNTHTGIRFTKENAVEYPRNVPDLLVFDRNSSPLDESRALVPKGDRPLLRRGARTNFKRNSSLTAPQRNRKSESDSIDSLRRLEEDSNIVRSTSAEGITLSDALGEETLTTTGAVLLMEEPSPMLSPVAENEEVRDLCIATREETSLASPSPPAPVVMARSVSTSTASSNQSRKSTWSWAFWSDEKSSKKNNKIDPNATTATSTAITEDDKTADTTTTATTTPTQGNNNNNKRFTLSSLFSRKSKSNNNSQSSAPYTTNFDLLLEEQKKAPKDFQLNRMHMTRLPLHVERAVYKLSHVKLANPRRPLHEQVLISNQMFWYLSVIATNAPHPASSAYDMSSEEQTQKKAPRKRLVKKQKQRPVSAPQQPQHHHPHQHRQQAPAPAPSSNKKRTHSHSVNSNSKGNTPMFMANPRTATNESTGFVVPENYLNPKQQQQQQEQIQQQQQKKKPALGNNTAKKVPLYHKQQQGSDSSSSDDDDDDDDADSDDEEHRQGAMAEKIIISHSEKEDELPLAMYKSNGYNKKIK